MKPAFIVLLMIFTLTANGQATTYINNTNSYESKSGLTEPFFDPKINDITLKTDSTFEFWSRPNVSCFTWQQYKGTWKKEKDTITFSDNYEVVEKDMRMNYKNNKEQKYHISFSTDRSSELKNKEVTIEYMYDYNAHLKDSEKIFNLNPNNSIEIPFQDIPNHEKLAAIRIEYLFNYKEKRDGYLTENKITNVKTGELPNTIEVEFVENPKKETVYRTIKAVLQNGKLTILSQTKTRTTVPDYYPKIVFEDIYALQK